MSRAGSPSQSRRELGQHSYVNSSNHNHFRPRPSGVPSSSGSGNNRLNQSRVPSTATPTSQQQLQQQQQQQHQQQHQHQQHNHHHHHNNNHQHQQQAQHHQSIARNLSVLLGKPIKLKIIDISNARGERWVEGKLWCYDPLPGIVILASDSPSTPLITQPTKPSNRQTFRMIKLNQVRETQLIDHPATSTTLTNDEQPGDCSVLISKILEPVGPINVTAVAMRETQAVKADDARRARIGHGVCRWGQEVFDALGKTLPVRWHQTSIVILD
ncbi:hypothetical protein PPACK8108_LOCUS8719, partial [Phakopsora pachyrhizi]